MRLQISWNAFLKSRTSIEHGMGANVLYHQHLFHQHAKKWANPTLDLGPFVLVHGDLGPQNLMVDDGLRITAVIDWEWSRVVPIQFFTPPLWLTCRDTVSLSAPSTYKLYLMKGLSDFLRIVEARELGMFQNDLLFREWNTRKEDGGPLVANALENWTDIDWFAYRYLSQGNDDDVDKHVKAFIEADPIRGSIVRMKEDDAIAYEAELQQLKDDESRYDSSSESQSISGKLLRYRTGISSMAAAFLPSKHTKLWSVQSTPMVAVASVVVLGGLLIGKRMVAAPNLLAR
ncbi:phosphotransferase enzyme family protein [Ilyonectria robusta]